MSIEEQQFSPKKKRRAWVVFAAIAGLLLVLFLIGTVPRLMRRAELVAASEQEKSAVLTVRVTKPFRSSTESEIELPGSTQALQQAAIYARVNGYVQRSFVDIGATVRSGQRLAQLETPELDQELLQARATLEVARSNYERLKSVTMPGAVSEQDLVEKQGAFHAARANTSRLETFASFKQVTAPFSGIITARSIDVGTLVSGGISGKALFQLEKIDTLRVFINVPQSYAALIKPGAKAQVFIPETPNKPFEGVVVRTAGALDESTRTLLTEIHVPNKDHAFLSGMYVQVKLGIKRVEPSLMVPDKVLKFGTKGIQVATVKQDGIVHFQTVQIGRDYGSEVEISSGLQGNELLVLNLTDDIYEGRAVKTVEVLLKKKGEPEKGQKGK
ncbi:MAG: efflux RND transporter periplasmic adaptor subunit [Chlorobiales bacterium]|jgi:membrane fusion protein, multidrug efflux system|nr:efflux RND transporter periplasmic adaptor subunit [Chlorobiales bacterium]